MESFQYEWWTVEIKYQSGTYVIEFKGKSKENVIKQIEKEVKESNSQKNLEKDFWHRKQRILEVYWDTLQLDRKGYQRKF